MNMTQAERDALMKELLTQLDDGTEWVLGMWVGHEVNGEPLPGEVNTEQVLNRLDDLLESGLERLRVLRITQRIIDGGRDETDALTGHRDGEVAMTMERLRSAWRQAQNAEDDS